MPKGMNTVNADQTGQTTIANYRQRWLSCCQGINFYNALIMMRGQVQGVSKKTEFSRNQLWEIFHWLMRNPIEFFSTNPAVLLWDNVFQWTCDLQHVSNIHICPFWTTFLQDIIKLLSVTRQGYKWSLFHFTKCPPPAAMHFTALSLMSSIALIVMAGSICATSLTMLACSSLRVVGFGFEVAP